MTHVAVWSSLLLAAAASGGPPAPVRPGLEVLLTDSLHLVAGRRVGLLTNQAGIDRHGVHAVERLRAAGVNLVALFSPEHGFRGAADPGAAVASSVDSATGLPIYSLYGRTRAPTDDMLRETDVLLVDLPDVGARYFTYLSTTLEVMKVAARLGLPIVILDRPNPIGGAVQGNLMDPAYRSFVGPLTLPMRPGMTLGELARLGNAELAIGAALSVVPAANWVRSRALDETGLPFVAPSPNLQSLESLFHYPGTCLFEGTVLSVGRGTDQGYRQVGAPWLDTTAVLRRLRRLRLRGVAFEGVGFTPNRPADGKFDRVALRGIRLRVVQQDRYDPTATAVAMLTVIRDVHPKHLRLEPASFDRLAGGPGLRGQLESGLDWKAIVRSWERDRNAFLERRARYLIYR